MENKKIYYFFSISVLVLIIIEQVINIIFQYFNASDEKQNFLSSAVIITFALFCISVYIEMQQYKKSLKNKLDKMTIGSNIANTIPGKGSKDFYELALQCINESKDDIWLTSLSDNNPNNEGPDIRSKYFNSVISLAKKNKVNIRRIIRIATYDKFKWVEEQLKSLKNFDKVSIAYVGKDTKILNLQVFDESIMLLWNPGSAKVSEHHNEFIYIENEENSKMFAEYYEK